MYIFHFNKKGSLVDVPRGTSSEQWGELQDAWLRRFGGTPGEDWIDCFTLYPDCQVEGVHFHDELAGPGGVSVILFKTPDISEEQVQRAKIKLHQMRDVVRMHIMRVETLLNPITPTNQAKGEKMKTFKNKQFKRRDYETTNVVFCQAESAPNDNWMECAADEMAKTTVSQLWIQGGVRYFGWL